jgi:hypothetical protein
VRLLPSCEVSDEKQTSWSFSGSANIGRDDHAGYDAHIDPTGTYRYSLRRPIEGVQRPADGGDFRERTILWIMLNPSTADHRQDDPTIRKIRGFSQRLLGGFHVAMVANLFALRSTDPGGLKKVTDPVGQENDQVIATLATASDVVMCAWGNHGSYKDRDSAVLRILRDVGKEPYVLKLTEPKGKSPQPYHPLYVPYETVPFRWSRP